MKLRDDKWQMPRTTPEPSPASLHLDPAPGLRGRDHTGRAQSFVQRRLLGPILDLLRVGTTPEKLAWSLAVGVACGINPLLGSTTVVCFVVAIALRLNLVASQIANHLVYPLELALFFAFLRLGRALFGTSPMPFGREALLHGMRQHPLQTTRILWTWEWHALLAWLLCSTVLVPLLAFALTPALRQLARRRAATAA